MPHSRTNHSFLVIPVHKTGLNEFCITEYLNELVAAVNSAKLLTNYNKFNCPSPKAT